MVDNRKIAWGIQHRAKYLLAMAVFDLSSLTTSAANWLWAGDPSNQGTFSRPHGKQDLCSSDIVYKF